MKALIEKFNNNRIAQVEPDYSVFPVAPGFEWVSCPDDCKTDWSFSEGRFIKSTLPVMAIEEQKKYFLQLAQDMMDSKVRERNYDGIMSACSYSGSTSPKFAAEAAACMAWRDAVWEKCYELLDAIKPGDPENLTEEDFMGSLPELIWPKE